MSSSNTKVVKVAIVSVSPLYLSSVKLSLARATRSKWHTFECTEFAETCRPFGRNDPLNNPIGGRDRDAFLEFCLAGLAWVVEEQNTHICPYYSYGRRVSLPRLRVLSLERTLRVLAYGIVPRDHPSDAHWWDPSNPLPVAFGETRCPLFRNFRVLFGTVCERNRLMKWTVWSILPLAALDIFSTSQMFQEARIDQWEKR